MAIRYEWDIETKSASGDIEDHWHADKLIELEALEENQDLVLVRDVFDDCENLIDRQWAYVTDGILPDEFDGGNAVPLRFRKEFARRTEAGIR